jgi:hypothetical protein
MKRIILNSLAACLLFSQLHADEQKNAPSGYVTQCDAAISSSHIWSSADGREHQCVFVLSDGMRWMTSSQETYNTVAKAGWTVGDRLTIWLTPDGWLAKNHERLTTVPLIQLCNKGLDYRGV